MKNAIPLLLSLTLALSACAGPITAGPQASKSEIQAEAQRQNELVYQKFIEDQNRIYKISFPIMTANAEFCGDKSKPLAGMTAWNIHTVPTQFRPSAKNLFNLGERLAVQHLARNSPASRAGILSGDIFVSINGQPVLQGKEALKQADQLLKSAGDRQSQIVIERNGKTFEKILQPVQGCDFPVVLDYNNSQINAFADGTRIIMTKGIIRFAENDNEIAMIIAHELGHSALTHVNKLRQNAMIGTIGGLIVDSLFAAGGVSTGGQFGQLGGHMGAMQHSVAFEQEADYVGMYFMERAGFDSANVANFWRRMAAEGQSSINQRTTHPTSPERFLAMEGTHREINDKKSRNAALVPNLKKN